MAKKTGLGANFYYNGVDLSGDIGAIGNISKRMATLEMPDITQYAMDREPSQLDGAIEFNSWFNPDGAHPEFSALTGTDKQVMCTPIAPALGGVGCAMVCKQVNYDPTRGNDGSLSIAVNTVSNAYWLDWGKLLTAGKRSDSSATNGTGVDFSASSSFGLQAYLQVFSFTGTDCDIELESSSDDGSSDAYAAVTGGAFTQVTEAPTFERIQTARDASIERYLRVATSGTFTEITFAVLVAVNRVVNNL